MAWKFLGSTPNFSLVLQQSGIRRSCHLISQLISWLCGLPLPRQVIGRSLVLHLVADKILSAAEALVDLMSPTRDVKGPSSLSLDFLISGPESFSATSKAFSALPVVGKGISKIAHKLK